MCVILNVNLGLSSDSVIIGSKLTHHSSASYLKHMLSKYVQPKYFHPLCTPNIFRSFPLARQISLLAELLFQVRLEWYIANIASLVLWLATIGNNCTRLDSIAALLFEKRAVKALFSEFLTWKMLFEGEGVRRLMVNFLIFSFLGTEPFRVIHTAMCTSWWQQIHHASWSWYWGRASTQLSGF